MAWFIDLREENFLARPAQCFPLFYSSLKSAELAILIFAGIFTLKSLKKRFGFKTGVVFEEVFNPGPVLGKCIRVGGPNRAWNGLFLTLR